MTMKSFATFARREVGTPGGMLLAYVAALAGYTLLAPGLPEDRQPVIDVAQVVMPLVAALLTGLVSTRAGTKWERWSWRFLCAAYAADALAEGLWAYYEIVLGIDVPTPSLADAAYGLYYPLAFIGLMLHAPRGQRQGGRLTSTLDALIFTLGAAGLSWLLILAPSLAKATDPLTAFVNVSWPLGDLLLTFGLISLILRWPLRRISPYTFYLLAALAIQIAVDTAFSLLFFGGYYETGNPIDPLWALSYAMVGLAALSRLSAPSDGDRHAIPGSSIDLGWMQGIRMVLPYFSLPATGTLVFLWYTNPDQANAGILPVLVTVAGVIALILLRQFVTLVENHRLSRSLAVLSEQLEARVVERTRQLTHRTQELAALNRIATQLSRCLTAVEVQSTGLELVSEVLDLPAGVVWLQGRDGRAELATQRGMSEEGQAIVADLAEQAPLLGRALTSSAATQLSLSELPIPPSSSEPCLKPPASLLVVPMLSRKTVVGAMGMISRSGVWSDPEVQFAQAIGAQLGVALENARRYEDAKYLADRDPVTGLLNHRAVFHRLDKELKRSQRSGSHFSIVIMDLDDFKLFNDTYGHPIGDQVLRAVAALLTQERRKSDEFGRYGGDEFVAILPETGLEGAVAVAQRLRTALTENPYVTPEGLAVPTKMSFGIATYPENGRQVNELVGFADANLYQSKEQGGDTITVGDSCGSDEVARVGNFGVLVGHAANTWRS